MAQSSPLPGLPKAPQKYSSRRRWPGFLLGFMLLGFGLFAMWYYFMYEQSFIKDAVVEGTVQVVYAETSGVVQPKVKAGQFVQAGEVLFVLQGQGAAGREMDLGKLRLLDASMREQVVVKEKAEVQAQSRVEAASRRHAKSLVARRGAAQTENAGLLAEEKQALAALEAAKQSQEKASNERIEVFQEYQRIHAALLLALRTPPAEQRAEVPWNNMIVSLLAGRVKSLTVKGAEAVEAGQQLAVVLPVLPGDIWVGACIPSNKQTVLEKNPLVRIQLDGELSDELTGVFEGVVADEKGLCASHSEMSRARFRLEAFDPLQRQLEPGQRVSIVPKQ